MISTGQKRKRNLHYVNTGELPKFQVKEIMSELTEEIWVEIA